MDERGEQGFVGGEDGGMSALGDDVGERMQSRDMLQSSVETMTYDTRCVS